MQRLSVIFRAKFTAVITVLVVVILTTLAAFAEQRELKTESTEKIDAVLLLDTSGSMLQTDRQNLRNEGAKIFLDSLKDDDQLAVVQFAADAKVIRPLAPFKPEDVQATNDLIHGLATEGQYTDILAAVTSARDILQQNGREDASKIVILLSDGKMDPDPALGSPETRSHELLDNVLPALKSTDIKVHTLYFSEEADKDLLSQIAAATDGLNWFTPSAEKIHESYTSLFLAVKKPQIVPLTSKGFQIDENVQEATFYVNRDGEQELAVISPEGGKFTSSATAPNIRWFKSEKFDVITIIKPDVGSWQIEGMVAQEGFATVLTDLKLVSDWAPSIYSGSTNLLQARLYETEKPVVLPEMTGSAQYAYQVTPTDRVSEPIIKDFLVDDGSHGDKIEKDGIFSSEIRIDDPGEYKLTILLKAPTFERTQQIPFRVKPRFISLRTEAVEARAEIGAGHDHEQHEEQFVVELSPEATAFNKPQVKLLAVNSERARLVLPLAKGAKPLTYTCKASALAVAGSYKVQAFVTGKGKKGELQEESNLLEYEYRESGEPVAEVEVVIVDEKPKDTSAPWWPYAFLVLAVNSGMGMVFLGRAGSIQVSASFAAPNFAPLDDVDAGLAKLISISEASEIDLSDPRLTKDFQPKLLGARERSSAQASEDATTQQVTPETPAVEEALVEAPPIAEELGESDADLQEDASEPESETDSETGGEKE